MNIRQRWGLVLFVVGETSMVINEIKNAGGWPGGMACALLVIVGITAFTFPCDKEMKFLEEKEEARGRKGGEGTMNWSDIPGLTLQQMNWMDDLAHGRVESPEMVAWLAEAARVWAEQEKKC